MLVKIFNGTLCPFFKEFLSSYTWANTDCLFFQGTLWWSVVFVSVTSTGESSSIGLMSVMVICRRYRALAEWCLIPAQRSTLDSVWKGENTIETNGWLRLPGSRSILTSHDSFWLWCKCLHGTDVASAQTSPPQDVRVVWCSKSARLWSKTESSIQLVWWLRRGILVSVHILLGKCRYLCLMCRGLQRIVIRESVVTPGFPTIHARPSAHPLVKHQSASADRFSAFSYGGCYAWAVRHKMTEIVACLKKRAELVDVGWWFQSFDCVRCVSRYL